MESLLNRKSLPLLCWEISTGGFYLLPEKLLPAKSFNRKKQHRSVNSIIHILEWSQMAIHCKCHLRAFIFWKKEKISQLSSLLCRNTTSHHEFLKWTKCTYSIFPLRAYFFLKYQNAYSMVDLFMQRYQKLEDKFWIIETRVFQWKNKE